MLYVVEMAFDHPTLQSEWDDWYMQHLDILLGVPGFRTAQRFRCLTPWPAPYLALYTVDSPEVFVSAAYRARGGRDSTGKWQPLMTNWDRNLFDGLARAPAVAPGQVLVATETGPQPAHAMGLEFFPLTAVGLDRTVDRRYFAVAPEQHGSRIVRANGTCMRAYRPMMEQRVSAHA